MNIAETNADTIIDFMNALEVNELELAERFLAQSFTFNGWLPHAHEKQGFLRLFANLKEGIPGLIFNLHNIMEEDEATVTGTMRIAGYQSQRFALPELGIPEVAPQGRSISLPSEDVTYRLEHGQIVMWTVSPVDGGGLAGLLRQVGIEMSTTR